MNWLYDNWPFVLFGALLVGLGIVFWWAHVEDARECEETGMHDVCQDWVNINGGMVCLRWKKEPCEP